MQMRQTSKPDHGIDNLLAVRAGTGLSHLALLNGYLVAHATRLVSVAADERSGEGSLLAMSSSISRDSSTMVSG
jgi:hypothetical protein